MGSVCFYFQVHQPYRLRRDYSYFNIGDSHFYEDEEANRAIIKKVAEKCYLPANKVMLELIKKHEGRFKISYSISGLVIDQFKKYTPEVIESFNELVDTGNVELLSETYYHSLAFQYSKKEFRNQVQLHTQRMKETFGVSPTVFRNTELIYNDDLALEVESMGYKGILSEGTEKILGWRSPNYVYQPAATKKIALLLKNYRLSDDIAFRFSNRSWKSYPLTAEKYASWIQEVLAKDSIVNLFMDYETFGEHQWADTGIFDFLTHLPERVLTYPGIDFKTPSEIINTYRPVAALSVPEYISWADTERDLSAWSGNAMQSSSLNYAYSLEEMVQKAENKDLTDVWRKLQSSDHFYYMSTKQSGDGAVHSYFSPYNSPYDAFVVYNNVLTDLKKTLEQNINS